jgi:MFS family permease
MTIYSVAALSFLLHCGFGGGRVTVTLFAIDRGASAAIIGLLMSLMALFPMLLAVPFGRLTDRVGVRPPALVGCIGVTSGLLLPAIFPALSTLFVAVLLLGTSFTCYQVAITNLVGALGGPQDRTRNYSVLSLGFAGATFLGPLIAGFAIDGIGHRLTFPLLAAWAVAPLIVMLVRPKLMPNIKGKQGEHKRGGIMDLMRIARLRDTFIVGGVLSSAWDLYQFLLPIYAHSIGLSASRIGMVLSSFALAIFAVRASIPALSRRYGESQLMTAAIFVCGLAFLMFPFCPNAWLLAAASIVLGLGVGAGQPIAMTLIYNLAPAGRQGEATGVRVSVNHMTHVAVPLLFGTMGTAMGFLPIFMVNAAAMMACGYVASRSFMR